MFDVGDRVWIQAHPDNSMIGLEGEIVGLSRNLSGNIEYVVHLLVSFDPLKEYYVSVFEDEITKIREHGEQNMCGCRENHPEYRCRSHFCHCHDGEDRLDVGLVNADSSVRDPNRYVSVSFPDLPEEKIRPLLDFVLAMGNPVNISFYDPIPVEEVDNGA